MLWLPSVFAVSASVPLAMLSWPVVFAHSARAPISFDVGVECFARNGMGIVAPVGEKVAQPKVLTPRDERLRQIRDLIKDEEPIGLCHFGLKSRATILVGTLSMTTSRSSASE